MRSRSSLSLLLLVLGALGCAHGGGGPRLQLLNPPTLAPPYGWTQEGASPLLRVDERAVEKA